LLTTSSGGPDGRGVSFRASIRGQYSGVADSYDSGVESVRVEGYGLGRLHAWWALRPRMTVTPRRGTQLLGPALVVPQHRNESIEIHHGDRQRRVPFAVER
jgi:hypothetical protein